MSSVEHDLRTIVEAVTPRLLAIGEEGASARPGPGKWCAKEVIGHLVDSASHNHQRFVRAQLSDDLVSQGYDGEAFVRVQPWAETPWEELVALWRGYNLHIARLIARTPAEVRDRERARHNLHQTAFKPVPEDRPATLAYFMRDYVDHLESHLEQALPDYASRVGGGGLPD
jgi:hypothetical protein